MHSQPLLCKMLPNNNTSLHRTTIVNRDKAHSSQLPQPHRERNKISTPKIVTKIKNNYYIWKHVSANIKCVLFDIPILVVISVKTNYIDDLLLASNMEEKTHLCIIDFPIQSNMVWNEVKPWLAHHSFLKMPSTNQQQNIPSRQK